MRMASTIAQCAWMASNLPSARRFASALQRPAEVQGEWLMRRIAADAESMFGREHDFASLRSPADFARRVPMRDWDGFAPWVERIRLGEKSVLGIEEVTHLAPTSGSLGARKLIPFTASLHRGFTSAVAAGMVDVAGLEPGILGGPAYWSISPLADEQDASAEVPVGFVDDAEYLGGWRAMLARVLMAVPSDLRLERDVDRFWLRTATHLLAARNLRLISVWHPSFLDLLIGEIRRHWDEVLSGLEVSRAAELAGLGSADPAAWWPALRVISCWGDLAAAPGMKRLAAGFPGVRVQAKGLLATEAVVTIPWRGGYPLAVTSHFFEFLDASGEVRQAHQLTRGEAYEVVVTNGGGLWRYRLGDLVECDGWMGATPTLRFLGRSGRVSDLCGEKLSEPFVAGLLAELWPDDAGRPLVAFLRAVSGHPAGYDLVVSHEIGEQLLCCLEERLQANPHYALARRLGQLRELRMVCDPAAGLAAQAPGRQRLGDIKPAVLVEWRP